MCTGTCDALVCEPAPVDWFYPYIDVVVGEPVLLELELPASTVAQVMVERG